MWKYGQNTQQEIKKQIIYKISTTQKVKHKNIQADQQIYTQLFKTDRMKKE